MFSFCFEGGNWKVEMVLLVPLRWRNSGSSFTSLQVRTRLMEWSVFDVWFAMGDAKDGCFSSFYMGELFGVTLFFGLEYGSSLFNVANLEETKYLHFWGHWEIYGFFEVFASWDIVWVVSYLAFYTMYFHFWFHAFYLCLICLYLFLVHFVHHHEHDVLFLMKISKKKLVLWK